MDQEAQDKQDKLHRRMARMVQGGSHPSQVAELFDVDESVVNQAAEKLLSGEMDELRPLQAGAMLTQFQHLIYNHYSGWMIVEWNRHTDRWMDLNHTNVVEDNAIIIAFQLPEKPR
jgi:hypothetical protein